MLRCICSPYLAVGRCGPIPSAGSPFRGLVRRPRLPRIYGGGVRSLTVECVRWAQLARYEWNSAEGLLRRPGEDGYRVLSRPEGRAELVQLADDGTSERVLYAADGEVLECYLFGLLVL